MNLSGVDLNLFVVLHAVLEERSATRAARRLHVTQSAVSNSLARLRELLADPLVVRNGRGLAPTPRAEALAPVVAAALGRLEEAVTGDAGFSPERTTRTFTLCAADSQEVVDVPHIAAAFARRLPRATLRIVTPDYLVVTDGLASGDVDAAFAPAPSVPPGHLSRPLFDEVGALLVRRDHPRVPPRARMTRRLFNSLQHIDVQVALGRTGVGHRVAARHWLAHGLTRQVALAVPHFLAAATAAARTDYVAAVPRRAADVFRRLLPLRIVPAAFDMPTLTMVMQWHPRTDADPAAAYFRELLVEAVTAS